ncbi:MULTISPECIES: hypothetical protein [Anaerosinus]|uniref:Uncharacterized protein n=1 Tax=Selenobaculum gibii TaxID=3054208 RepID=A0A9Y2AK01_9FIRM|nr:hypothetical protein [Selenobaculum gbiensis]WIW71286.1 hypothetical protein P3F81_02935 [Selenobaculum gbiensis]
MIIFTDLTGRCLNDTDIFPKLKFWIECNKATKASIICKDSSSTESIVEIPIGNRWITAILDSFEEINKAFEKEI